MSDQLSDQLPGPYAKICKSADVRFFSMGCVIRDERLLRSGGLGVSASELSSGQTVDADIARF